jgi:hypothetical protein
VGRRRCWWAGREGGPRGEKERREEGRWAVHCCWAAGVAGLWARKERREGEKRERGLGSFLLFSNLFKLLKLNSFSNFKFKLILKLFKTTHYQTKTMHFKS